MCVLQTLMSAKTCRASTMRCVYKALAVSPVCVMQVTLVSCVRQVSGVFFFCHSVESRHFSLQRKYFLLLFTSTSVILAAVLVQRVSQSTDTNGLKLWLN